jgi:hypothetical protein
MKSVNSPEESRRLPRSLRALLILGCFIAVLASASGALILYFGYQRPDVVQPLWKCGQQVMLLGLISLGIYVAIIFQVRRMLTKGSIRSETPTI